jgi:CDP-diacylglycerol--serine O-phosphatidyltransferase
MALKFMPLHELKQELREFGKRKKFVIPCSFTLLNACFGFFSIIKTLEGDCISAAYLIVGAAWMDMIDGRIARRFGSTSAIGKELDSLADAVSFCVAPAILLYNWLSFENFSLFTLAFIPGYSLAINNNFVTGLFLSFYLCAGISRLARFNANTSNPIFFTGLPTPMAAFFITQLVLQITELNHSGYLVSNGLLLAVTVLISVLMVSNIKYPSFKKVTPSRTPHLCAALTGYILLLFVTCWVLKLPFFLLLITSYILLGSLFQHACY